MKKPLSSAQEAGCFFSSAVAILLATLLLRHEVDWSDPGVVVIWIVAMLLLTAAIRLFVSKNTGEDGRMKFKFFQRMFPPEK